MFQKLGLALSFFRLILQKHSDKIVSLSKVFTKGLQVFPFCATVTKRPFESRLNAPCGCGIGVFRMRELENKIIYQIYPKSFRDTTGNGYGDINGIIEKLDYLKDLGVDYLWLSPICKSPQRDNGYDIADYYTIDPLFGDNKDYETLLAKAKEKGMKIMMDLVLNHTSDEHEWFQKALKKDPKYYNYYIFRDKPNELKSGFGGSAWTYSQEVGQYYFHLFDKTQPDLNWENPEVREEIHKMVNYWIDKGVEGFRLDVIDLIGKEPDKNITSRGPKFNQFLEELNQATFQDKLLTVGECWGSSLDDYLKMCQPKGLTQAFHFNHLSITEDCRSKWIKKPLDLTRLAEVLTRWQNESKGIEAVVMNNHDLPRLISLWLNDQEYRKESAKLLVSLFGLMRGNLYLYQGEEFASTNCCGHDISQYNDVESHNRYEEFKAQGLDERIVMNLIAQTSRDNPRVPLSWNREKNAGFSQGEPWLGVNPNYQQVNAEDDLASADSVYRYYQKVIAFRKENYDLIDHDITFQVEGHVLSFTRGNLQFVGNFDHNIVLFDKPTDCLFSNYDSPCAEYLRPYEVFVKTV